MTDFHYACWLSELAVDLAYQRRGIGKMLVKLIRAELGPHCKLRLVPAAADYWSPLGFSSIDIAGNHCRISLAANSAPFPAW